MTDTSATPTPPAAVVPAAVLSKWKAWAADAAERVIATFAQAFLGALAVGQFTTLSTWKAAALAGFAAVLSLVKSYVAAVGTSGASASLVPSVIRSQAINEFTVLFGQAQDWLGKVLAVAAIPPIIELTPIGGGAGGGSGTVAGPSQAAANAPQPPQDQPAAAPAAIGAEAAAAAGGGQVTDGPVDPPPAEPDPAPSPPAAPVVDPPPPINAGTELAEAEAEAQSSLDRLKAAIERANITAVIGS
ncbi:MAG: holin [Acidimicrobiales bacterium]